MPDVLTKSSLYSYRYQFQAAEMIDLPIFSLARDFQNIKISNNGKSKLKQSDAATQKEQSGATLIPLNSIKGSDADSIPSELWILIFSHLSLLDIGVTRKVCKKWRYSASKTLDSICRGFVPRLMKPMLLADLSQESSGNTGKYMLTPRDMRDHDWIEFGLDVDNIKSHGFIGLASKISQICSPLFSKNAKEYPDDPKASTEDILNGPLRYFDRDAYASLNTFLRSGWKSLEDSLPLTLRPAYASLFRHILQTFDSLVDRPAGIHQQKTQLTSSISRYHASRHSTISSNANLESSRRSSSIHS